jgi:kumamolisin
MESALQDAALKGTTVVAASGMNDTDYPSSSQWVLAVGGTTLVSHNAAIESEGIIYATVSADKGIKSVLEQPSWQHGIGMTAGRDGSHTRSVPDVSALGDAKRGYKVRIGGGDQSTGGTSTAAALWAGLIARLNQGCSNNLGYFNPKLYKELGPAGVLNKISGTDDTNGKGPLLPSEVGWNPRSGWGTPDARKMLEWLRSHPN